LLSRTSPLTLETLVNSDNGTSTHAVEAEIRLIEAMSLHELRGVCLVRWGFAPRSRSADLLRYLIAWRLQAELFGGLDAETKVLLRRSTMPRATAPPGSRLTREYRGVLHHVDIDDHGFSYHGQRYDSLSAIARRITGTRWNGPRFFGLRKSAAAP
jgi:hypothetical protein